MYHFTKLHRDTLFLSLMGMIERISYFGIRAVLVLYLVKTINLTEEISYKYFGLFTLLVGILPLPVGIATDFLIGQKRAVLIGFALSTVGCFLLIVNKIELIITSIVIISIGSSLIKLNTRVLTGRLFHKNDNKRNIGFLIFFFGRNVGGFLAPFVIGYIGELYGWNYSFVISGIIMIAGLLIFGYYNNKLIITEEDWANNDTLISNRTVLIKRFLLIIVVAIISIVLFNFSDIVDNIIKLSIIYKHKIFNIGSFQFTRTTILLIVPITYLIAILLLIIHWSCFKIYKTIIYFGLSFLFFSTGLLIILPSFFNNKIILSCYIGMCFFHSFAEVVTSTLTTCYITRLSPVKYSSTILGGALLIASPITFIGSLIKFENMTHFNIIVGICVISAVIGITFVLLNKLLNKLSYGIE